MAIQNNGSLQPQRPFQTVPRGQTRKSAGGCGLWLFCGCIIIILGFFAIVIAGFVAYQTGIITPTTILNLAGLGPADIEVDNFRDDTIQISILQLDVASDQSPIQTTFGLNAFDVHSYRVQQPGRYRVDFGTTYNGADLGTCTLTLKSGDQYQFVALPERIAVNRLNDPPSVGTDLIVATSTLCR